MILTSLMRYYEALADRGAITPLGFSTAKVSYGIKLSDSGEVLALVPLHESVIVGKKTVERPRSMRVPEQALRGVDILSYFLCDHSSYLFGYDEKGKPARTKACHDAAKALHLSLLAPLDSPVARAIVLFFESWNPDDFTTHPALAPYQAELLKSANLVFMHGLDFAQDDPAILEAWLALQQAKEQGEAMICLASGEKSPIARLHPKIKGVRGAQAAGASLVSFNARAFESYGYDGEQGLNAPVSEYAAFTYATALNTLLADPNHRTYLSDMTIVYWSEDGNEAASEMIAVNFVPFVDKQDTDSMLHGIFEKIARAQPIGDDINPDCPFCILGLAPNNSRLSVRFFLRDSFGAFIKRIKAHYDRMEIVRPSYEAEYVLIPQILAELSNPNATNKEPPHNLAGALVRDIIGGYRYPASMFTTTIMRIRADHDDSGRRIQKISRARAAMVKAYLLHNASNPSIKEVCSVSLNEETMYPAYLLGRLFSVLEKAQEDANPGINTTIKDRYFNAACATPASVFPTLLKLSNHHLKKLAPGPRIYLEKQMTDIIGKLEAAPLPARLSLEDQGLFILGYYQQTQARYAKKNQNKEETING